MGRVSRPGTSKSHSSGIGSLSTETFPSIVSSSRRTSPHSLGRRTSQGPSRRCLGEAKDSPCGVKEGSSIRYSSLST